MTCPECSEVIDAPEGWDAEKGVCVDCAVPPCPICGEHDRGDVTISDHGRCWTCQRKWQNGEPPFDDD